MDRVRITARDSLGHFPSLSCFLSYQFLAIWGIITLRLIALTKCFICIMSLDSPLKLIPLFPFFRKVS